MSNEISQTIFLSNNSNKMSSNGPYNDVIEYLNDTNQDETSGILSQFQQA